jgi:hypothetical protein
MSWTLHKHLINTGTCTAPDSGHSLPDPSRQEKPFLQCDSRSIRETLSIDVERAVAGFDGRAKGFARQKLGDLKRGAVLREWAKAINPAYWRHGITINQGNGWSVSEEDVRRRLNYIRVRLLKAMFGNNSGRKGKIHFLVFKQGSTEIGTQHFHALMGIEGLHDWSDGKIAEHIERSESERKRGGWEKPAHVDWNWGKGNDFHKYVSREAALQPDSFELF